MGDKISDNMTRVYTCTMFRVISITCSSKLDYYFTVRVNYITRKWYKWRSKIQKSKISNYIKLNMPGHAIIQNSSCEPQKLAIEPLQDVFNLFRSSV